jgi:hypothetical protein
MAANRPAVTESMRTPGVSFSGIGMAGLTPTPADRGNPNASFLQSLWQLRVQRQGARTLEHSASAIETNSDSMRFFIRQVRGHTAVPLADAEFDSERNHTYVRQQLHARSIIPAKRGKKTWRIHGVRAEMRRAFRRQYAPRALVETVFSTVKRKLSARAPGRSLFTQLRQALLLGLAYNLYRL